jgi:hypothetical protein
VVTSFAVLPRIDGCVFCCEASCQSIPTPTPVLDQEGRQVFDMRTGQFLIVVEGVRGLSGFPPSRNLEPGFDGRPDLQIQSTRPMGDGSATVCDTGQPPVGGGVPGIFPPTFNPASPFVTGALMDFACRFESFDRSSPCTLVGPAQFGFIDPAAESQFCDIVAATAVFPPGESIVTARLRDALGNVGPSKQIVIRVATPTPRP